MTLVMLVIITISGITMMQVMESGSSAAGNIAFRQSASSAGDIGVEAARAWLLGQSAAALEADTPTAGYYSFVGFGTPGYSAADPNKFNPVSNVTWVDADTVKYVGAETHTGYRIYYIIHRFSRVTGDCNDAGVGCITAPDVAASVGGAGTSKSAGTEANAGILSAGGQAYFRVTVKVVGPKFNSSYIQVVFH
jgi:Tfp pilus assembly protein PilX